MLRVHGKHGRRTGVEEQRKGKSRMKVKGRRKKERDIDERSGKNAKDS